MTLQEMKNILSTAKNSKSEVEQALLCRLILKNAVEFVFEKKNKKLPKNGTLLELIDNPVIRSYFDDPDILNSLDFVRILGMNAEHDKKIRKKEAQLAVENIQNLIDFLEAAETDSKPKYKKPGYMSEAETRSLYVDRYLKEAG